MKVRKLVIGGLVLAASLLAAEIVVRLAAKWTGRERGIRYDSELGWRMLPHLEKRGWHWSDDEPAFTNSAGWRDTEFGTAPGRPRIAAIGDSFTFGLHVDHGERFTELLETCEPGWEVENYGSVGFGPDQELLVLEREVLAEPPEWVVFVSYLGNDLVDLTFERKNQWPKPRFELEAGELRLISPQPSWDVTLRQSSYLGELLFRLCEPHVQRDRAVAPFDATTRELYLALVQRAAESTRRAGARFLLVLEYIRQPGATEPPPGQAEVRARLAGTSIELLDTWDLFAEAIARGETLFRHGHWSPRGHELLAEALCERIRAIEAR